MIESKRYIWETKSSFRRAQTVYGSSQTLWDLDLRIPPGSCTCVMGRNGVGKTTLLKCIMGLLPISGGRISVNNRDFTNKPAEFRAQSGIAYVPQGREIFPTLTVKENLLVSLNSVKSNRRKIPDRVFDLFPVLTKSLKKQGGDLSGGNNNIAIARALINPTVLILDEP